MAELETAPAPPAPAEPAAPPPGTTVTPSGGIVTHTDGSPPAPDWRASLPVELQAEKNLEPFKDVGALAKSYLETKRRFDGAGGYPGADARPEVVTEYRKRSGVPASAEEYRITLPEPPPGSGMEWGPQLKGFLGAMHAAHARPEQVQAAIDYYAKYAAGQWDQWRNRQAEGQQSHLDAAVAALEQKWGPRDGPMWQHYKGRAELAIRTLMSDAAKPDVDRIVESCNDPEVAHAFAVLADSLLERGFLGEAEMPSALGAQDAQTRADEMAAAAAKDRSHPLTNRQHPDHERTYKQYLEWQAIAAGPRGREMVAEVRR